MRRFFILIAITTLLASCTTKTPKVKSPCVSNGHSGKVGPCVKRPVNTWLA